MTDECPDCIETEARAGFWHCYQLNCHGCTARAVARSLAAWKAIRKQDPDDLREMTVRMFPKLAYEEARALVWRAWQVDHQDEEVTT